MADPSQGDVHWPGWETWIYIGALESCTQIAYNQTISFIVFENPGNYILGPYGQLLRSSLTY